MTNYTSITIDQVKVFIEDDQGVVIDTLPPEHFAARHIPEAVNACVYEMVFLDSVGASVPDKDTPIVLYGAGPDSRDSIEAAEKLTRAGYTDLRVFEGGLEAWRNVGEPLDGDAANEIEPPHPLLSLEGRKYSLVADESVIRWTGRNNNGGHYGTLGLKSGEVDGSTLQGALTIDMTSIRNEDLAGNELQPVLEAHLNSDDFFFTRLFPEAVFAIRDATWIPDAAATQPNYEITGELTLRGVTRPIQFPAQVRNVGDNGEKVAILGHTDFDRTEWGILYGSARFFQHLSYHVVYDDISVDFRIVLA